MLALSYAAQKGGKQAGVLSVSVGSIAPSYRQLITDRQAAARQLLGAEGADALLQANLAAAAASSSGGSAAWQQYQQQYVCRFLAAMASGGCATRAVQQRSQPVFEGLAGGQYFAAAGSLADWSVDSIDTSALQVGLPYMLIEDACCELQTSACCLQTPTKRCTSRWVVKVCSDKCAVLRRAVLQCAVL